MRNSNANALTSKGSSAVRSAWRSTAEVSVHQRAAALDQQHVPPVSAEFAEPFSPAHHPEASGGMHRRAGLVLREDARLDRPDAGGLGGADQHLQQPPADASTSSIRMHVYRVLDHAGVGASIRHRAG